MKTAIALTAAALVSLGIAGTTPAAAYHLSPSGSFVGDGTTSATKNGITLPCKAHFTGTVDSNGVGHVTGGSFTDNGATGCKKVKLANLPWGSRVPSATKVIVLKAKFNGPLTLDCGPSNVPTTLKNGVITFTAVPMTGSCSVSGKITTTPKLSIVP